MEKDARIKEARICVVLVAVLLALMGLVSFIENHEDESYRRNHPNACAALANKKLFDAHMFELLPPKDLEDRMLEPSRTGRGEAPLAPDGEKPVEPRLVLIDMSTKSSFDAGRYGISDDIVARNPGEANVVVYVVSQMRVVGSYGNGVTADRPIEILYVVEKNSKKVIQSNTFVGGMPDKQLVRGGHPLFRSGSAVGRDPEGMAKWVNGVFGR